MPHAGFGWPVAVVLVVAAIGALLAIRAFGPEGRGREDAAVAAGTPLKGLIANGFYIDDIYQKGIGGLVNGISIVVGSGIDPYVLDGAINGVGALVKKGGEGIRRLHSGFVRRYTLTVFAGVAIFLIYFILV